MRKPAFTYVKTKVQISCPSVAVQLIKALVESKTPLHPKSEISSPLLSSVASQVFVRPRGHPEDIFCSDKAQIGSNYHYANTPMQDTAIFHSCKNVNFQMKFFNIFLIFAQNIDCGFTIEPPH